MKVSIFTTYTNPDKRNDPWKEALECYEDFADEIVVKKGQDWPYDFSWDLIGKTFKVVLMKQGVIGLLGWILIIFFMKSI